MRYMPTRATGLIFLAVMMYWIRGRGSSRISAIWPVVIKSVGMVSLLVDEKVVAQNEIRRCAGYDMAVM